MGVRPEILRHGSLEYDFLIDVVRSSAVVREAGRACNRQNRPKNKGNQEIAFQGPPPVKA
jgi:hypothetical protein